MNSINHNQKEDLQKNLVADKAIEKMREIMHKNSTCFFCTAMVTGASNGARPMSVQTIDNDGNLWFLTANDSHTYNEVRADPKVKLYFQGSSHSDFMELYGKAIISEDKEKVKELWTPVLKTWFTEGEDDPRIVVIKFVPFSGYYWDNKHGSIVAGIKMLIGAVTGKTLDDSVEGYLIP